MLKDSEEEIKYICEGLHEIVPPNMLLLLTGKDLSIALSGNRILETEEVRRLQELSCPTFWSTFGPCYDDLYYVHKYFGQMRKQLMKVILVSCVERK